MLLQDIYAPEKFCDTAKTMPPDGDEEEDDEDVSAFDESENLAKKKLQDSLTEIVLSQLETILNQMISNVTTIPYEIRFILKLVFLKA